MQTFPEYESYKDSGVEWLGKVPNHWEVLPFKALFDIDLIKDRLERYHGNIKRVAEDLEVSRATIYDMIEKHKLQLQEGWDKYG